MSVTITSSLPVALVSGTGVTFSAPVVNQISTDDVFNVNNPSETLTEMFDAISSAELLASATIDGTTLGNTALFTVPATQKFLPTSIIFALTGISGSGHGPVINAGFTATAYRDYIDSVVDATYDLSGGAFFAPGSGYLIGDILTLTGGTHTSSATVTLTSASLVALSVNAAGTVYVPGDTITLTGGVHPTAAIVTVSTVKLVSATVAAGGTGYGTSSTFNVTVAGGTHSTAAVVSVTTNGSGIVTTVNSVGTAGSYTVLPTLSGNAVTGDNGTDHGTGLTLNLVFGILAVAITTNGEYTTETLSFTQASTSGSGTGATFNSALYGAKAYTISAAGSYSVVPANHVATSGGAGTGASFDAVFSETAGDFFAITTIGDLVTYQDFAVSGNNFVYMAPNTPFFVRVAFPSTYTTYTLKVFLFGFTFT